MARAQAAGAEIKDKEFDGKAWASRYGGSFGDLIKQARRGIKKQKLDGGESASEGGKEIEPEKEDTPASLPRPEGDGESSMAPTPMDIVPPSSPPLPSQNKDGNEEAGAEQQSLAEDTAMARDGQVIPGTPEKAQWETSQQPPITGDV